jgi:probable rRNA maturation factor
MILLDPHLEPDPAPKAALAKRVGALNLKLDSMATARDVRLPSARTLSRFLATAQAAVRLKGQVTVLLTTDAAIRQLNKQFRGKNKATDVLSFPAGGLGAEGIAGDLAISVTTALGQAAEQGHSLSTEIKVLVLHGLLHLAGYDHEADNGQMGRRERVLRAKLKLPQGLIERVSLGDKAREKNPSGAKALDSSGQMNVRAEARTLQSATMPQGLKPRSSVGPGSARLKLGSDTKRPRSVQAKRSASTPKAKARAGEAKIKAKAKRL